MISMKKLAPVLNWRKNNVIPLCLGCDVGGSGIRIRLSSIDDDMKFVNLDHIKASSSKQLINALQRLSKEIKSFSPNIKCYSASMAVAGPNKDNAVTMTNWHGTIEDRSFSLSDLPKDLFPRSKTIFLNDLEAGSYGIYAAFEKGIINEYFEQMWPDVSPKGPIVSNNRTAVLAMGSGLGVGLIVRTALSPKPLVISTELGHLQIPTYGLDHPISKIDWDIVRFASDFYYNGHITPEFEDISSGRGLRLAYMYFLRRDKNQKIDFDTIDAGVIAGMARSGDEIAKKAVAYQYQLLVRLAKGVGTALNCDSLVLALDNQVKDNYIMHEYSDILRDEFQTYIRPNWMKVIRLYTQNKLLNFNILGADYIAHSLL